MALVEMEPFLIVGPRRRLDAVLDLVADEGLRLMPAPPILEAQESPTGDLSYRLAHLRQQITALLTALPPRVRGAGDTLLPQGGWPSWDLRDIEAWVAGVVSGVDRYTTLAEGAAAKHQAIVGYAEAIRAMAGILEPLRTVPEADLILVVVPRARRPAIGELARAMEKVAGRAPQTFAAELSGDRTATLLALPGGETSRLRHVLAASGLTHMDLPRPSDAHSVDPAETLARETAALLRTQQAARGALAEVARIYRPALESLELEVRRRQRRAALKRLARETQFVFALSAWVLPHQAEALRKRLADAALGVVVIPLPGHLAPERAPAVLRNPAFVQPYEVFLTLFPIAPQARLDPTPFIAISFPTFVGLMLGDIGQGAILAVLGLLLQRWGRMSGRQIGAQVGRILLHCGVLAMAFGLLFGEVFGLGKEIHLVPFLDRRETPFAYLSLVMGVGIGHLLTGYFLGLRTGLRERDWKRIARLLGELAGVAGLGLLLALRIGAVPAHLLAPGLLVLAAALVLLVYAAGYEGPLGVPSALMGFLSYIRLFAVGLASASLARAANQIGGLFGSAVLGIITAIVLHLVFLATGLATPLVQATRLQLVEFGGRTGLYASGRTRGRSGNKERA